MFGFIIAERTNKKKLHVVAKQQHPHPFIAFGIDDGIIFSRDSNSPQNKRRMHDGDGCVRGFGGNEGMASKIVYAGVLDVRNSRVFFIFFIGIFS